MSSTTKAAVATVVGVVTVLGGAVFTAGSAMTAATTADSLSSTISPEPANQPIICGGRVNTIYCRG